MDLPEFYFVESEVNLVQSGANGYKTNLILKEFFKKEINFEYVPIDISESAMKE